MPDLEERPKTIRIGGSGKVAAFTPMDDACAAAPLPREKRGLSALLDLADERGASKGLNQ